jgi:hypothetical protein
MATKSPCEHCGKEVTDIPHIRLRHVSTCKGADMNTATAEPVTVPVAEVVEPKGKKVEKFATDAIRHLVETARAKEKEFEKAPEAFISTDSVDEHMELRKIYAPETVDKRGPNGEYIEKAKRSAYIADKNGIKLAVQKGYVPKLDDEGNLVVTPHGDILCTVPRERSEAQQAASAKASKARLSAHEMNASSNAEIKSDASADASSVKTEEVVRKQVGE